MRTNGSQSGHIQVDRQTIETALDDEASTVLANEAEKQDKKKAGMPPDLLDILDNFLITTSHTDESIVPINQVSTAVQLDNSQSVIISNPRLVDLQNVSHE